MNSYTFTGPGERWSLTDPTATDFLNVSRINIDYIYEALETLTDTSAADGALKSSVDGSSLVIGTLSSDAAVSWTESTYTDTVLSQNMRRVVYVDLDDPLTLWDYEAFLQQLQDTNFHAQHGDPPVHGLLFITEDQTKCVWWNRETGAAYATLTGATDGIVEDATPLLTGCDWKDGKWYVCGTGGADATMVDLLQDGALKWDTSGEHRYGGTLGDLTGTAGWTLYATATGDKIVNATVNDIGATRDPELVDEFGRPKHWWAVGTAGGGSLYNPSADAIYDSSSTDDWIHVAVEDGVLVATISDATRDTFGLKRSVYGISADSWSPDESYTNAGADAEDLAWTNSAVGERVGVLPGASWASEGAPLAVLPSDEGVYVAHAHPSDNSGKGGLIRLHEDYASPYMKGDVKVCYPGHAVTDVSPAGIDLTNNSATVFSSGGPAGSYATGDGAADYLSLTGQASLNLGTSDFELRFLFKTDDASNPGSEEVIVQLDDGVITGKVKVSLNTSGQLLFDVTDDGDSTSDSITTSADFADGNWHHVSAGRDSGTFYLRVDGVTVGSTAVSNAAGSIDPTELGWLATPAGGSFFGGDSGGLVISGTAITLREVRGANARGLRRLQSSTDTNDTISDNDIAAVAADPHGRYVIIGGVDKAVQLWSGDLCVPVASDTYQGTTLRDVAIKSMPGGVDPHYLMGGSDEFEAVQPDTRL